MIKAIVTMAGTAAAIVAAMATAGCGHNVVNYSDGVGLETTFRPDSGNFGLTFRYGKILSATIRENSEVEMTGEGQGTGGTGDAATSGASSTGTVKIKIGQQITGYYVDALKAGATKEQLDKYQTGEKADSSK
jgi:hypothetical protein